MCLNLYGNVTKMRTYPSLLTFAVLCGLCSFAWTDEQQPQESQETEVEPQTQEEQAERFAKFEKTLTGATLVGRFTVLGDDEQNLRREEYAISSVQKLDEEDFWLFKARIKYGETDRTLPVPLRVKWAGDTPVITLDNVTIPGLGTFDARVLIHDDQYVGTWRHGDKGGQLFGVIERRDAADDADQTDKAQ